MHFDALTLASITSELAAVVGGGRVQQALMVDEESIGLEIYADHARHYLYLCAAPSAPRVHLASQKLRRGTDRQPPLLLLLRKYVRGAALMEVEQPDPAERMLALHFQHPEHGKTTLIVELIGRRANLILLDANQKILDSLVRVGSDQGSQRQILPNHPYSSPPPQTKLPPLDDGTEEYYTRLTELGKEKGKLRQVLVAGIAGTSPTLGREAAWRAGGDADVAAQDVPVLAIAQALQSLWAPVSDAAPWQPGLITRDSSVVGFTAYEAHVLGVFVPDPSISRAVESYYETRVDRPTQATDPYAAARGQVRAQLRKAQKRLQRQLAALDADEPAPGEPERVRMEAEWLLALNSQIQPGQRTLEVDLGTETIQIELESKRSAIEQAQRMFKRASKMERAAKFIPRRRTKLNTDFAFLEQLAVDLTLADNQPAIVTVREELQAMGLLSRQKKASTRPAAGSQVSKPLSYESPHGFEILVGRNARQNEAVTFRMAQPTDLWLHVRNAPGAHVVIRLRGGQIDEETVEMAAQLAAHYSRQRGELAAGVSVTEKRFVRRLPGGHTGQVTIRNERTITVPAQLPAQLPDGVN